MSESRQSLTVSDVISAGEHAEGQNVCILVTDGRGQEVLMTVLHVLESKFNHFWSGASRAAATKRVTQGGPGANNMDPITSTPVQEVQGFVAVAENGTPLPMLRLRMENLMQLDIPLPLDEVDQWIGILTQVRDKALKQADMAPTPQSS